MYAFCSMPKYPGHFWICYQMGDGAPRGAWPIKIVPHAFQLQKHNYPDMVALKNGFKMLMSSQPRAVARR